MVHQAVNNSICLYIYIYICISIFVHEYVCICIFMTEVCEGDTSSSE